MERQGCGKHRARSAMMVKAESGQFQGKCRCCKRWGHTARDCQMQIASLDDGGAVAFATAASSSLPTTSSIPTGLPYPAAHVVEREATWLCQVMNNAVPVNTNFEKLILIGSASYNYVPNGLHEGCAMHRVRRGSSPGIGRGWTTITPLWTAAHHVLHLQWADDHSKLRGSRRDRTQHGGWQTSGARLRGSLRSPV